MVTDVAQAAAELGGSSEVRYVVPEVPRIARDETGAPVLSLTLMLDRQPAPGDESIDEYLARGHLGLTVGLDVEASEVSRLPDAAFVDYRPLFLQEAVFTLLSTDTGDVLAEGRAVGAGVRAALEADLGRDQCLRVMDAIEGFEAGLMVRVSGSYRSTPISGVVKLRGSWPVVFDAFDRRVRAGALLDRGCVLEVLDSLLLEGSLEATFDVEGTTGNQGDARSPALEAMLQACSFILRVDTPDLPRDDARNTYSLRTRPPENMELRLQKIVTTPDRREIELEVGLDRLLGDVFEGHDLSRFIHLVGLRGPGDFGLIRPRVKSPRARSRRSDLEELVVPPTKGPPQSLPLTMTPDRTRVPSAHALIASDISARRPNIHGSLGIWTAHDVVVPIATEASAEEKLSLPIVDDPSATLFKDRKNPTSYWYLPQFRLIRPSEADAPEVSSFLFSFEQAGMTAGAEMTPGLEARLRFQLEQVMPDPVRNELTTLGNPEARQIPTNNLSITLEVPFKEQGTGTTKTQMFVAEIEDSEGIVTAVVNMLDDWVRLSYGALAYDGFQQQPATLRVAYAYRAYRLATEPMHLLFAGQLATIQIARVATELPAEIKRPVLVADDDSFHLPTGVVRFTREGVDRRKPDVHSRGRAGLATASIIAHHVAAVHTTPASVQPVGVLIAADIQPAIMPQEEPQKYVLQSVLSEQTVDALFPCATFGNFYRQVGDDGDEAVGCQDVLRLGEIKYRQYEEMPALGNDLFRVYRSLQQPGRFLVAPTAYRITRYAPGEGAGRAFRPVVLIYGLFEDVETTPRYVLTATLEPDIPYFMRRELLEALVEHTPHGAFPQLDYPTDPPVQAEITYAWALDDAIADPEVYQIGITFQVSASCELADALLLTKLIESGGLSGSVEFQLPDGQKFASQLVLGTRVIGPWELGPLEIDIDGDRVGLTNRCEQTVDVPDLVVADGERPARRVGVDLTLDPGATAEVVVKDATDDIFPIYSARAGDLKLEQLNVFVEDVEVNVLFTNLLKFENHGLKSLTVEARLKNSEQAYELLLAEGQTGAIDLTLPLSTYAERQVLEFRIMKTLDDGTVEPTAWKTWDLFASSVVPIDSDLIG